MSNLWVGKLISITTTTTTTKKRKRKERGLIITHAHNPGEDEPVWGDGEALGMMVGREMVLYPGAK